MHRNTDCTGLIRNGARNRLPDPPRCIGGELVATAVFKLIHRLHQADIAFLNQIKELKAAVGVFFGNGNNQAQVGFNHFLFSTRRITLTTRNRCIHTAEFTNWQTRFLRQLCNLITQTNHRIGVLGHKVLP